MTQQMPKQSAQQPGQLPTQDPTKEPEKENLGPVDRSIEGENERAFMTVELHLSAAELAKYLQEAYLSQTDRYPLAGVAPGLAGRDEIESVYGPEALHEEALDLGAPKLLSAHLLKNNIRIVGRPKVTSIKPSLDGGYDLTFEATLRPKVLLGPYKGLVVPLKPDDSEEAFERAVMDLAVSLMKGVNCRSMVDSKLEAMEAKEKLSVHLNPVYHLLSDISAVLRDSYQKLGVNRSPALIRAESLDAMLDTVSDDEGATRELLVENVKKLLARYRDLPEDFGHHIGLAFGERAKKKAAMTPAEMADEAFGAYLGSVGLTLSQWRIQARRQAELSAREDLLLEAVAEAEDLEVDEDEIMAEIRAIAAENATDPFEQIEPLEVLGQIGRGPIVEKLLRDKARRLIIKSAVGLNEPGSAESGAEGPSAPAAAIASNDLSGQAPAAQPTKVRP